MSTPQLNLLEESFSSQVYSLAQQEGSRLLKHVMQGTQNSQSDWIPRIGISDPVNKTRTFSDTPEHQIDTSMRGITTVDRHINTPVLEKDMNEAVSELPNNYLQQLMMGHGRRYDIDILQQLVGNALTRTSTTLGEYTHSTEAMSAKNRIAVLNSDGDDIQGLSVDLFPAFDHHFGRAKIADSMKYVAATVGALYSMYKDNKFINNDYFMKSLLDPSVVEFNGPLGYKIIKLLPDVSLSTSSALKISTVSATEGQVVTTGTSLTVPANSYDRVVIFCKTGFRYNMQPSQNKTKIDERKDKSYDWQVYTRTSGGGVRLEEDKVLELIIKRPSVSFKNLGVTV